MAALIQSWMDQFGYYVLGLGLMLELLALPLPGEILMSYAGLLAFQDQLNWFWCIVVAGAGSSIGMTISYAIGYKLGQPFIEKYGARIHIGPDKLRKTSVWFERYGNKVLLFAYYIPGVRHFTGYFSGVTRMPFRTYMMYAYTGAFIWAGIFISFGKLLGPQWERYHSTITKYMLIAGIISAFVLGGAYLIRKYRQKLYGTCVTLLRQAVRAFHSLGRVKLLIVVIAAAFLGLFSLMAGLIQDFLASEFADFDAVTDYLVHRMFTPNWSIWMERFMVLASPRVLLPLTVLSLIWVAVKGRNRLLEAGFMCIGLVGGVVWAELLRRLFHRVGPGLELYSFPSSQTLMLIVMIGFAVYLFVRHINVAWIRTVVPLVALAMTLLYGISLVYFNLQYPSDVAAGFVFGGVWLSLNALLLEIFRFIRNQKLNDRAAYAAFPIVGRRGE
jgi:membrane protein DedA with SNARE-associated domain/membrane-associated phospholipid phosphatase